MQLSDILDDFLTLLSDAVAIGFRGPADDSPTLLFANPAFCSLFGVKPEEAVGGPVDRYHDPAHHDAHIEHIGRHLAAGDTAFTVETGFLRADGSRFWASVSFTIIPDDDTGGHFIITIFRNISDLKNREEAARRALADYEKLLEDQKAISAALLDAQTRLISAMNAYPDPFAIYDKDFRLVTCNTAYRASMTTDPARIAEGMHVRDVLIEAIDSGRIPEPVEGRAAFLDAMMDEDRMSEGVEDLEFAGDVYNRVLRSKAENGDTVIVRVDTTELVRQRRSAEEAQARLLTAINAYPDPFVIYDKDLRLVICNTAYKQSVSPDPDKIKPGILLEEVMRESFATGKVLTPPEGVEAHIRKALSPEELRSRTKDLALPGDRHHHLLRSRAENGDLVVVRIDMTELVRKSRALEATQKRLISSIDAFPDPFAIYDRDLRLLLWNPAFAHSITKNPDDLVEGMTVQDVLRLAIRNGRIPVAEGQEEEWIADYFGPDRVGTEVEEFEFANDEHYRIVRSQSENGEILVLRINITESVRQRRALQTYAKQLEDANHEITHKAFHDQLTGLGNRRYLAGKFEEMSKRRKSVGGDLAALHIDLDRFKQINDTIGHAAGDHVLIDVANRIQANVRKHDIVARIGGDEFVILLWVPEDSDRPEQLARALIADLSRPSHFDERECRFGASIGIARTPLAEEEDLLVYSDVALYKAKRGGRGRVGIFDQSDIGELRRTKVLADEILRGLESSEFVPFYQPQIDAYTGQVVGVEALARWNHPEKGVLPPEAFLAVASDLDVVAQIDRMIFERAICECEEAFAKLDPIPSLSFNVSAKRVRFDKIAEIARRARRYSGEVAFELLETIFLEEESDGFLMQLDQLRDLGITLEVDDFGSGRASVVALQRIAPDRLKIDGRLVRPMARDNAATRLVQSIIDIGRALEIGVTAEGVETRDQVRILAELGADRLQGYFFSPPRNIADLKTYIGSVTPRRRVS